MLINMFMKNYPDLRKNIINKYKLYIIHKINYTIFVINLNKINKFYKLYYINYPIIVTY